MAGEIIFAHQRSLQKTPLFYLNKVPYKTVSSLIEKEILKKPTYSYSMNMATRYWYLKPRKMAHSHSNSIKTEVWYLLLMPMMEKRLPSKTPISKMHNWPKA